MKKATTASILRTTNGSQLDSHKDTELRQVLGALAAFRRGNFSVRLPEDWTGLAGKKILIVDDDIRNIFAMTSLLERYKINVISAETGKGGIEALQKSPDIDLVLMDIMLPEMDGYDTMRTIRRTYRFNELPIVALTAKAMKGDREKCIDAGASDYIAKPVETEELLSLLRNWSVR